MKPLRFHPDVGVDIKGSYEWCEDKSKGLGARFISELEHAYEALAIFHTLECLLSIDLGDTYSPVSHLK